MLLCCSILILLYILWIKKPLNQWFFILVPGNQSHRCDPGIRCIGCPSIPPAKRAGASLTPDEKKTAYAVFLIWCRGGESVTQARPRHPLHRMPFDSPGDARRRFAYPGRKKNCIRSLFNLVPGGGIEPPRPFRHRILSPARLPVPSPRQGGAHYP
jgi:hypothetical protein